MNCVRLIKAKAIDWIFWLLLKAYWAVKKCQLNRCVFTCNSALLPLPCSVFQTKSWFQSQPLPESPSTQFSGSYMVHLESPTSTSNTFSLCYHSIILLSSLLGLYFSLRPMLVISHQLQWSLTVTDLELLCFSLKL